MELFRRNGPCRQFGRENCDFFSIETRVFYLSLYCIVVEKISRKSLILPTRSVFGALEFYQEVWRKRTRICRLSVS